MRMASFWKFRGYKFQSHEKKNKKKAVESRDMRLIFLSRSMDRQVTVEKLFLLIDSKKAVLTNIF